MNISQTNLLRRGILVIGLLTIAIIHVLDLPSKWSEVRYLGVAYLGAIVASLVLAERLVRKPQQLDYLATALLSASIFVGFTLTRTVGLPGATDDIGNWLEPLGLVSILVEAMVVWNSLAALKAFQQKAPIDTNDLENNHLLAA